MNPFVQDGYLLPIASLNMLPVGEGQTAKEFCAANVTIARVHGFLTAHGIDTGKGWLNRFVDCLEDPTLAEEAHACVDAIARAVCRVPLTLKGFAPQSHPDWNEEHWAYWASIDRLYLAGGMLGTAFGPLLVDAMRRCLHERGLTNLDLRLAPYPPIISVLGAARFAARRCENALVFDLGHTNIKCGSLSRENGRFCVHSYPIIPSREMQWDYSERAAAEILHEHITDVLTALHLQVASEGRTPGDTIVCSVANYVSNGHFAARAGYGKLNLLTDNYAAYLSDALLERLGRRLTIHFLHDGTAGAYAVQTADWRTEAFLGLGTSLSVGFPDERLNFPFSYDVIEHTL